MRIVTGSVFLLMIAAQPALSSEAFVTQVTNRAIAREQAAVTSAKSAFVSAMLALPVKPGVLNSLCRRRPKLPESIPPRWCSRGRTISLL
jgi:hypothetical protein